ncbi:MAG: alpha-L-glutamate ligase, partial [Methylococcaceae bacterium]|nr:alpha-L-glutamate ligase [Methylococcaceae bacterium]
MARIAIITDDPGWHGARLREAFGAQGFESRYVSLTECRIIVEPGTLPVRMPSFETVLPDGVFVRGVPGGSLEQVVHYLDILHALKRLGIVVYNDARAIERSVDKAMTSFLLQQARIPTPPTWVTPINSEALGIARRELAAGHRLVAKPIFGSQGQGLQKLESTDDLGRLVSSGGIFYLQRFVENGHSASSDWRVFVIHGKAQSAMRRYGRTWLNNVAQGARCEIAVLDGGL